MFITPIHCENSQFWSELEVRGPFSLQQIKTARNVLLRNVLGTIRHV
jgi:hypothetical protein